MKKQTFKESDIPMRTECNALIDDVPIVGRSPSFQQPLEEAAEMTREALRQRDVKRGS